MSHPVHYRITAADPAAHLFSIEMTVRRPAADGQVFRLPRWIPGSYLLRDFSRHLGPLSARSAHGPVTLTALDNHSWQAAPCHGPLTLSYTAYAFDLSVRGAYLDRERGFFNPTSLCLEAVGQSGQSHGLRVDAPAPGTVSGDWRLAGTLPADGAAPFGFGDFVADSYDTLIDHPFELGHFDVVPFRVCNTDYEIVVSGRHRGDLDRLARDVARICEWQIRLFGEPAPFHRYQFQLFVGKDVYGGLEHRDSTALMASRDDLPVHGDDTLSDGYLDLLGLFSHEHFHAWNVKRIKPAAFTPYDLSQAALTSLLWAFEGVTSYYDDLTLVRSGVVPVERYLAQLARTLTAVQRGSGRHKQTLAESSLDAWTKYYQQNENSPNAIVSYYQKGALAALALDLKIRQDSHGTRSLDDVMRALWRRWRDTGAGIGETEWERIAQQATGLDLGAFFDQAIRSTADLPLQALLQDAGVTVAWRAAQSGADKGGAPLPAASDTPPRAVIGVRSAADPAGIRLTHVLDGGAAQAAGLSAGDVLVAIDGLRASDLERQLARHRPGDSVRLHAFRRDELLAFDVIVQAAPADTCWLAPQDTPLWLSPAA